MTRAALVFACLAWAQAAAGAESTATLKGLDLYRSNAVTLAQIRAAAGPLIDSYLRLRADKQGAPATWERLRGEIDRQVRALGPLAFVRLSYNEYVSSSERTAFATFDIVDTADAAARMPFSRAPQSVLADPDGVLAAWLRYVSLGEALLKKGELPSVEHPSCPGFYCLWGSPTPELASLERNFTLAAASRRRELVEVLAKDSDALKRAAAVYVLSYSTDSVVAVDAGLAALRDPAEEVRAAGLLVLADVSLYHKTAFIDVSRVLPVLDYPLVADRSKALSVLVGLTDNPNYRTYLTARAGPLLLALLKLRQPANHDLAYMLLATISGRDYERRDYDSWNQWIVSQAAAPTPAVTGVSAEPNAGR